MTPAAIARLQQLATLRRRKAEAELARQMARRNALCAEEVCLRAPAGVLPESGAFDPGLLTAAAAREQWRLQRRTTVTQALRQTEASLEPARQDLAIAHGRELALENVADSLKQRQARDRQRREDDAPPATRQD